MNIFYLNNKIYIRLIIMIIAILISVIFGTRLFYGYGLSRSLKIRD